jgi:hypothetical protein
MRDVIDLCVTLDDILNNLIKLRFSEIANLTARPNAEN